MTSSISLFHDLRLEIAQRAIKGNEVTTNLNAGLDLESGELVKFTGAAEILPGQEILFAASGAKIVHGNAFVPLMEQGQIFDEGMVTEWLHAHRASPEKQARIRAAHARLIYRFNEDGLEKLASPSMPSPAPRCNGSVFTLFR